MIHEKYGQQFYITSLDGKVAQVYPFEELERIEQKLAGLSNFNPTKKKFLDWDESSQKVEMDGTASVAAGIRTNQQRGSGSGNLTFLVVRRSCSRKRSKKKSLRPRG